MITKREKLLGKVVDAVGNIGPGARKKDVIKYLEREDDGQDTKPRHYGLALKNAVDCGLVKKLKSGRYSMVQAAHHTEDGCGRRGRSRSRGKKRSASGCQKKCKICRNKCGVIIACPEKKEKKAKKGCKKPKKSASRCGKRKKRSASRSGKRRRKRKRSKGRCGKRGKR